MSAPGAPENLLRLLIPADHAKRCKLWDRAFTSAALKSYQLLLSARITELRGSLLSRVGAPLDLAAWMTFFSTDFMGDFACGGKFALMAAGADEAHVHQHGLKLVRDTDVFGTVPWIRPLVQGAAPD